MSVHQSLAHDSARRHADGTARYIDDLPEASNLLHLAVVMSPFAHATLTGIDTAAALALPGVVGVYTARDIPGRNDVAPAPPVEHLLADGLVEYLGQPVAVVAASDYETARRGAALVKVHSEPLPALITLRQALEAKSYVRAPVEMSRGEPDALLAAAPHCLTGELEVGGQEHFYLEGQVALAVPMENNEFLVHASSQHPTEIQEVIGHVLHIPFNAVTVEVRRMGGGFGGKESQAALPAALAALVASKTGRPAKLRYDRDTDMTVTGKRHEFLLRWQVGVDNEGRIQAVVMELAARCGFSVDLSPAVISRALSHADNAYFYPAVRFRGLALKTNTQSNTAFRGFGAPQGMIAAEAMIDHIARALKLDPLAVRQRNFYGNQDRNLTPYHQTVENFKLPTLIDQLLASSDYHARRAAVDAFNATSPVIKKGLALSPVKFGVSFNRVQMNQAGALVHVYTDGSVTLNHGGTEMGQGLFLKVGQVVAEVFGIDIRHVRLTATSTDKVPNTSPTAASSGTDLNGMAAKAAAETIKGRMTEVAAEYFGVAAEIIVFADGLVKAGNRTMTFAELAHLSHANRVQLSSTGYYRTPTLSWDVATMRGKPFYYFVHSAAVSEVAIDTLTGEWKSLRTDILHDAGKSLNPAVDKGQVEGAFVQGAGWLTLEELVWNKEGRLLTHAPSTYKIPTARDMPLDFRVSLLENAPNEVATIYRSKAIGEPPLMLGIAVWLALRDAVASVAPAGHVPTLEAPATPERILAAVSAAKAAVC